MKELKKIGDNKGLSGLLNLGNTCYFNSVIQALSNTRILTNYILTNNIKKDINPKNNKFVSNYCILIANMWIKNEIIKPKSLYITFCNLYEKYKIMEQQDAYECFLNILEVLHKEIKYEIEAEIKGDAEGNLEIYNACKKWIELYKKGYSEIIKNFNGMIFNKIICKNCGGNSINYEPYNSISIPKIKNTLKECLNEYFQCESIDSYYCENCKRECNSLYTTKIYSFPEILVIHLKHSNQEIIYPLNNLDVTDLICIEKKDPNSYVYDLYSVIYHKGTVESGHYFTCAKNNDKWYCFDDANVFKVNESEIINKNAYILFYKRRIK